MADMMSQSGLFSVAALQALEDEHVPSNGRPHWNNDFATMRSRDWGGKRFASAWDVLDFLPKTPRPPYNSLEAKMQREQKAAIARGESGFIGEGHKVMQEGGEPGHDASGPGGLPPLKLSPNKKKGGKSPKKPWMADFADKKYNRKYAPNGKPFICAWDELGFLEKTPRKPWEDPATKGRRLRLERKRKEDLRKEKVRQQEAHELERTQSIGSPGKKMSLSPLRKKKSVLKKRPSAAKSPSKATKQAEQKKGKEKEVSMLEKMQRNKVTKHLTSALDKLPTELTEADRDARRKLFDDMDPNENGILSLAEVDRGIRDVLKDDQLFDAKPAIMRAFQAAKDVDQNHKGSKIRSAKEQKEIDDSYIERVEFRLLLVYLRMYFEMYLIFDKIDGDDRRIDHKEFNELAVPKLQEKGLWEDTDTADAVFNEIDANHGGQVLFDEFATWVIKRELAGHVIKAGNSMEDGERFEYNHPDEIKKRNAPKQDFVSKAVVPKDANEDQAKLAEAAAAVSTHLTNALDKLPTGLTPADRTARKEMFDSFDPNGNGILSLAEVDKGIRDVLKDDELFDAKPAIIRAFTAAKAVDQKHKGSKATQEEQKEFDDAFIERVEFRLLLVYLKMYFELYLIFDKIDGEDRRIDHKEFEELAMPALKEKGLLEDSDTADGVFNEIDSNHGGQVLFAEFTNWVIQRKFSHHLKETEDAGGDERFEYAN